MNCEHVQTMLGRLHDGELDAQDRGPVEAHLRSCPACSSQLAAIRELAELSATWSQPEPPGDLWKSLEERMNRQLLSPARKRGRLYPSLARRAEMLQNRARSFGGLIFPLRRTAALAALVFLAVAAGWLAHGPALPTAKENLAAEVATQSDLMLDDLLAFRSGERVSLQEAAQRVDFRVLAANDLPENCRLEECCLCKSAHCDLVRCKLLCRGERMLLVQGGPEHPVCYGSRAVLETQVNGQTARIAQCEGCLACSWQNKGTALTLIGPRDLAQLVELVAYVDQRLANRP